MKKIIHENESDNEKLLITCINIDDDILMKLQLVHKSIHVGFISSKNFKLDHEDDYGFVEYKRSILDCDREKIERYATQMRWRITENIEYYALYYIGVDDNGKIFGMSDDDIINTVDAFLQISTVIDADIISITIIQVIDKNIICIRVELSEINDDYILIE